MKNKLLFYCIAIFACLAILFSIHYLTKPEEMPVVTRNTVSGQLSYDEVNEFVDKFEKIIEDEKKNNSKENKK